MHWWVVENFSSRIVEPVLILLRLFDYELPDWWRQEADFCMCFCENKCGSQSYQSRWQNALEERLWQFTIQRCGFATCILTISLENRFNKVLDAKINKCCRLSSRCSYSGGPCQNTIDFAIGNIPPKQVAQVLVLLDNDRERALECNIICVARNFPVANITALLNSDVGNDIVDNAEASPVLTNDDVCVANSVVTATVFCWKLLSFSFPFIIMLLNNPIGILKNFLKYIAF